MGGTRLSSGCLQLGPCHLEGSRLPFLPRFSGRIGVKVVTVLGLVVVGGRVGAEPGEWAGKHQQYDRVRILGFGLEFVVWDFGKDDTKRATAVRC